MSTQLLTAIVPIYGAYAYAIATLTSLFEHTPNVRAVVVNDCSPEPWPTQAFQDALPDRDIQYIHLNKNVGLTQAWNAGAYFAMEEHDSKYMALLNSDLLFTPNWTAGIYAVLAQDFKLVGPLTNAPGASTQQDVRRWTSDYQLTDYPAYLSALSEDLWSKHGTNVIPCDPNGFCLVAEMASWRKYGYKPPLEVFPSLIPRMPSGKKNPHPRMTGNDDWICSAIKKRGGRIGASLGSFVFHYRSVSRGDQFKQEGAYRVDQH